MTQTRTTTQTQTRKRRAEGGRAVLALIRLLPQASAALTAVLAALLLAQALLTVGFTLGTAALIGDLVGGKTAHLWLHLAVLGVIFLLRVSCQPTSTAIAASLGRRLTLYLMQSTLRGVLRPVGIGHLADPAVVDRMYMAQGVGTAGIPPGLAVAALASVASSRLAGAAAVGLLASVQWWMPVPLAAGWLIVGRWRNQAIRRAVDAQGQATPSLRHAAYARDLATDGIGAKEIRVFGLQDWLLDRFTRAWLAGMTGLTGSGRRLTQLASVLLLALAHAAVLIPLAVGAARGTYSVAVVTIALQAIGGLTALGSLGDMQWQLTDGSAAVPAALAVSQLAAGEVAGPGLPAAGMPASAIVLERVHFGYPERPVLRGIDLDIPACSSLALVGSNGAGKSTLIKLLGRLYDPVDGRITVDGTDLRDLDPLAWRRQLAVVFQDFVHYELPLRDNVGFGRVDAPRDDAALAAAARLARLDGVAGKLPGGWDTPLSRRVDGGVDLSGGQWQRVVLARALFAVEHGARVLILDEPTAHLDVRAEADLYERFLDITKGLTTILVSHRFATVRLADKICVLDAGKITEQGSHDELVAAGGHYAEMFELQSAPFREAGHA